MQTQSPQLSYRIPSSKAPRMSYLVTYHERQGFACDCPDFYYRRRDCKHIRTVLMGQAAPERPDTDILYTDGGAALDAALAKRRAVA